MSPSQEPWGLSCLPALPGKPVSFPTLDLEMLFSCANVLSCEAAVPFAVEQCLSSHGPAGGSHPCPGKLCLRFLKELSHPKHWKGFSEQSPGLSPSSAAAQKPNPLLGTGDNRAAEWRLQVVSGIPDLCPKPLTLPHYLVWHSSNSLLRRKSPPACKEP